MERRKAIVNALLGDGGSLTNYTPTLRERVSDGIRRALFTDDRAGQQRAEKVSNVLDFTPVGMATGAYDAGREAGQGNLATGGLMMAMAGLPGPNPKGFKAYHGSPHDFDRFSLDKIGTGVGAPDAFSRGLYFSESEKTAEHFKTLGAAPKIGGRVGRAGLSPDAYELVWKFTHNDGKSGTLADVARDAEADLLARESNLPASAVRDYRRIIDELKGRGDQDVKLGANMYEVNINADPASFAEWDKPVSEQNETVKSALSKFPPDKTWREIYESGTVRPKDMLNNGVHGTTYRTNDGSRNYVVFDDKLIDILKKYGLGSLLVGGGAAMGGNDTQAAGKGSSGW